MRAVEFLKEFDFKNPFASTPVPAPTAKPPTPTQGQSATVKPQPPVPKLNNVAHPEAPEFHPAEHKDLLTKLAQKSGFNTNSLAQLLANASTETLGWKSATEGFNYKDPVRIYRVFTSNFSSPQEAEPYVGKPVALANRALANKLGNGDEASGDGWRYRGRGFIHITGKDNYQTAGTLVHPKDPLIYVNRPDLLSSNAHESALASIAWFKNKIGLKASDKKAAATMNPVMKGQERVQGAKIERQKIQKQQKGKKTGK